MLRKIIVLSFCVVGAVGLVYAGVLTDAVKWSTADSATASIVAATKDTSQTFSLITFPRDPTKSVMVSGLGVAWNTTEYGDSTYVYLSMDVSADASTWVEFAKLDTITTEDADEYFNVDLTDMPPCPYGRFRLTGYMAAGDTVTVTTNVTRLFD